MGAKPIKYIIGDWSGGIVTIISPRDLQEGQFQELIDINNQFPGRITKGLKVKEITTSLDTNGSVYIFNDTSGASLYNYRTEWTFDTVPTQIAQKYWIYVGSVNSAGSSWGVILINQETGVKDKVFDLGWTKYGIASTTTSASTNQLKDTGISLITYCSVGDIIYNTQAGNEDEATVTKIVDADTIDLSKNIMGSGHSYRIADVPKPVAYFYGGNIRISDSVLTNENPSKFIGHINRKFFGVDDFDNGFQNIMSPNCWRPQISKEVNDWVVLDQELAPPKIIKMDGCFDPSGKVLEANDIGLYVYEPTTYSHRHTVNTSGITEADPNPGEDINWMDAQGAGSVFSSDDKYAFTYIYDGIQESELSRDDKGNIGITGFDCEEIPDNAEVEAMKYNPTATSDVADAIPIKVEAVVSGNPHDRYGAVHVKLTSTDADFGAHEEIAPGDYLEIGSEIVKVYKVWYDSDAFVFIHRGCRGTTPIDIEGKTVFRTSNVQKARAINIVVNTGAGTAANTKSPDMDASASGTLTFTFNKALGAIPNTQLGSAIGNYPVGGNSHLKNGYDADGRPIYNGAEFKWSIDHPGVPSGQDTLCVKKLDFNTDRDGSSNNNQLVVNVLVQNDTGDSEALTYGQLINMVNGVEKSAVSASAVPKKDNLFELGRWGQLSLSDSATESTAFLAAGSFTDAFSTVASGTNSDLSSFNKRITAIKLYWQPKGEEDWYHAMTYDINKGAWDDVYAQRELKSTPTEDIGHRNVLGDPLNQIGANFGAWIDCPFWNFHSGSELTQAGNEGGSPCVDVKRFFKGYMGFGTNLQHNQQAGGLPTTSTPNFEPDKHDVFGSIHLIAPIDLSQFVAGGSASEFNTSWHKTIGKFNQLRTMYGRFYARPAGYEPDMMAFGGGFGGINNYDSYILKNPIVFRWAPLGSTLSVDLISFIGTPTVTQNPEVLGYSQGGHMVCFKTRDSDAESSRYSPTTNYKIYRTTQTGVAGSLRTFFIDNLAVAVDFSDGDGALGTFDVGLAGTNFPVNHYGGAMWSDKRILDTVGGDNIGMECTQDKHADHDHDFNKHGYEFKSAFARGDCATTMYLPFDGAKLLTYQGLTDRAQTARIKPVRWRDSTIINAITVLGNIDIENDVGQKNRERSRILWTLPYRFDEFSFHRSRDIGMADADEIMGIESIQGGVIVMKQNNVYVLDPTRGFQEVQRIQGIGLSYHNAYTRTPFGVVLVNKSGIYMMPSKEELSVTIRDLFYSDSGIAIANPTVGFSAKLAELIFIPDTTTSHTGYFKYNFGKKGWTQHGKIKDIADGRYSNMIFGDSDEAQILVFDDTDAAHSGNDTVSIHEFNDSAGSTVSSTGSWKTKEYVFDSPDTIKYIRTLKLTYKSASIITCSVYVEGVLEKTKTIPISTSVKPFSLAINSTGKSISFKFETSSADLHVEDMEIIGWDTMKGD
jgi:hypothetical protein